MNDFNYKSALNETVDIIIITDGSSGKIIDVNKSCCQLLGYERSEITGKFISDFFDKKLASQPSPQDIFMYGSVLPNRNLITKSGELIPVDMTINTFGEDSANFVMTSLRDIRERLSYENKILLMNEELKEINASKDKLFSIIAHDLKNPFMALIGLSEIITEDVNKVSAREIGKIANTINKLSRDTYDLLDNLLNWANVQTKKIELDKKEFHLYNIASKVIDLLKPSADLKKIMLVNNISQDYILNADENMIKTIIRNLISNSIKFSNENTCITLKSLDASGYKTIIVEDEGIGMEENYIADLFNINKQTSRNGTNKERGTGLGLLLCNEFVKLHNGNINVISKVGKGTRFTINLPA